MDNVQRACDIAFTWFTEEHVQGLEGEIRTRDPRGPFQSLKSLEIFVDYIRHDDGKILRDLELILGRWVRFFITLLNLRSNKARSRHRRRNLPLAYQVIIRGRTDEGRDNRALEVDGKRIGSGFTSSLRRTL